jgi:hypothetical protein
MDVQEPQASEQGSSVVRPAFTYCKRNRTRWWEVRDPEGELVCLTVYRRGAREVVRRLTF